LRGKAVGLTYDPLIFNISGLKPHSFPAFETASAISLGTDSNVDFKFLPPGEAGVVQAGTPIANKASKDTETFREV
jgi:hypothetical protein